MGQLRTGIANLQKTLTDNEADIPKLQQISDEYKRRIPELATTANEGPNVLLLYLTEKFKPSGGVAAHAATTMTQLADSHVADLVKGMLSWNQNIKRLIQERNQKWAALTTTMTASLNTAETQAGQLRALAQKKKDKWFKSSKYKDKVKGYLAALDEVDATIKKQKTKIAKLTTSKMTDGWVDTSFPFSMNMTVKNVADASSAGVDAQIATYMRNQDEADAAIKTFRDENKTIAGQLSVFRKWIQDADAMEEEVK